MQFVANNLILQLITKNYGDTPHHQRTTKNVARYTY